MKHFAYCIAILILSAACNERQKPTFDYNQTQDIADSTRVDNDNVNDTTKVLVAELPVKFDSTDVLIFPIGLIQMQERGAISKISSFSYNSTNASSGYYANTDDLQGNLINLIFRNQRGEERKLTHRQIKIRSIRFLRELSKKNKYLLYFISDQETNGDKELDQSDIESIYISRIDGTEFKKISQRRHEFYDYTIIKNESKIYFRTLEDKNKDGEFNSQDKFHYYTISFSSTGYSVEEFNPFKALE
jgi:hypothetical protein